MTGKTYYEAAFDVFSQFSEGLTVRQFEELMDTRSAKRSASARLSQFVNEKLAVKVAGDGLSVYVPTGRAFADRVLPVRAKDRGRKRPTDTELIELRRWKTEALRRFPDLAVPEPLFVARKKVAAFCESQGELRRAELTRAGKLDAHELVLFAAWLAEQQVRP